MIKNTTHSSIGCNGMANNDDYHGLEMYKNHAKDSTTEGYMQPDPTTMECGHHGMWPNQSLQSQGNAPIETEPMIKKQNKQKFKVRQPQRAAKSKRPNAPSDGSKNNGIHTTKQEEYPSRHPTTDTANSSTSKQITSRRLRSKNTTHSSIGCNGMANNDDYHGLEMYKNHAKDSTTEGYMQPDPTNIIQMLMQHFALLTQGQHTPPYRLHLHVSDKPF